MTNTFYYVHHSDDNWFIQIFIAATDTLDVGMLNRGSHWLWSAKMGEGGQFKLQGRFKIYMKSSWLQIEEGVGLESFILRLTSFTSNPRIMIKLSDQHGNFQQMCHQYHSTTHCHYHQFNHLLLLLNLCLLSCHN